MFSGSPILRLTLGIDHKSLTIFAAVLVFCFAIFAFAAVFAAVSANVFAVVSANVSANVFVAVSANVSANAFAAVAFAVAFAAMT